jgi:hypothetical protein
VSEIAKSKQQQWSKEHPNVIQEAQVEYNKKCPTWLFRSTLENIEWLEEEGWDDYNGKPESDAMLLNRKLVKSRKLEQQGF